MEIGALNDSAAVTAEDNSIFSSRFAFAAKVDNYGSAKTPIVGSQIEAFQGGTVRLLNE